MRLDLLKKIYKGLRDGWFRIFGTAYSRKFLNNCYRGLDDLPIFYWDKIHSEKNLAYLEKSSIISLKKAPPPAWKVELLNEIWRKMQVEFVDRFGFSEDHLAIMRKQRELIDLYRRRILTGDRSLNAFIKICLMELEELEGGMGNSGSFDETKCFIEDQMNLRISIKETSVAEFYGYLTYIKKRSASKKTFEE